VFVHCFSLFLKDSGWFYRGGGASWVEQWLSALACCLFGLVSTQGIILYLDLFFILMCNAFHRSFISAMAVTCCSFSSTVPRRRLPSQEHQLLLLSKNRMTWRLHISGPLFLVNFNLSCSSPLQILSLSPELFLVNYHVCVQMYSIHFACFMMPVYDQAGCLFMIRRDVRIIVSLYSRILRCIS
jgi:hypothetical protein